MLTPTFSHGNLFACFWAQTVTERCVFKSRFSVALLNSLADFATKFYFSLEKTEHANAPMIIQGFIATGALPRTMVASDK